MVSDNNVQEARSLGATFKARFGNYPPVQLGNVCFWEGQSDNFRLWILACLGRRLGCRVPDDGVVGDDRRRRPRRQAASRIGHLRSSSAATRIAS